MDEFEVIDYPSYNELKREAENDFSIYGDVDQYTNKFESIHMLNSDFKVGLAYCYTGLKPKIMEVNGTKLFIGFDKTILCVDPYANQLLREKRGTSLFYDFIKAEEYGLLVAIYELYLIVMDYEGEDVWEIGFRDIIEDLTKVGGILKVKCADGESFSFDIKNGQFIAN